MQAPSSTGFAAEARVEPSGRTRLVLAGRLDLGESGDGWPRLLALAEGARGSVLIDVTELESIDGAGAALLVELRTLLRRRGRAADFVGASGAVARMVDLYAQAPPLRRAKPAPSTQSSFTEIGVWTWSVLRQWGGVLAGLGDVGRALVRVARRPQELPWRDVPRLVERTGPDAVPIVGLIAFLVGLILAFQSAVQLKNFGAEIFVANLVGLSVVRELGPLMAAILITGRSGAAIAAELGTMRVSEEIDALRALGLSPAAHLVLPRLVALALCVPPLTLVADACGIVGGLVVGVSAMEIAPVAYWNQTLSAIDGWDIGTGLIKSVAFAFIIGLVACDRGLATRGGAEGVGRSATTAVVSTILLLVIADACFAWVFTALDL